MAKSLAQKMFLKAGYVAAVVNAPDGFLLGELPEGATVVDEINGRYDWLLLFVKNKEQLDALGDGAMTAVKSDAPLWIAYPKKSGKIKTDINRDKGWDVMGAVNWRPVTQVSIDETWSALRWRPKTEKEIEAGGRW